VNDLQFRSALRLYKKLCLAPIVVTIILYWIVPWTFGPDLGFPDGLHAYCGLLMGTVAVSRERYQQTAAGATYPGSWLRAPGC